MLYSRIAVLVVIAFLFAAFSNPAQCEVTVDPFGFAVSVGEDEETEVELTLANDGEDDVAFSIDYEWIIEEDELRIGPHRDDPGDFLVDYEMQYGNTMGLAWDEPNGWMWGLSMGNNRLYAFDPEEEEVTVNVGTMDNIAGLFHLDGVLYAGGYDRHANTIYRFDVEGNALNPWQSPVALGSSYIASDGEYLYTHRTGSGQVLVFDLENRDEVATIDYRGAVDNAAIYAIELVVVHNNGPLWLVGVGHLYQCFVDEDWNCELVQDFDSFAGDQPNREDGFCGIGHDGENLWRGTLRGGNHWYVVDDGVQEFHMLIIDPEAGIIPGNDLATITILVQPEGYEAGVYNILLEIELAEPEEMRDDITQDLIEISVVVTVTDPTFNLSGIVTDAATNEVVEGVTVDMDRYIITRFSDEEGGYSFDDLPPGEYELTFTATDYLPLVHEVNIGEEDVELNVGLLHSECNLSVENIVADLSPDTDTEVDFTVSNDGNGALTYTTDRRLLGDANTDPWGWRASFNVGATVDDNYLYGVVFINDQFYVSGENGGEPSIYVINRDGELVETIAQVGEDDDGVRDLAWDGELIWGTEQSIVLGFTPEGEPVSSFEGPYRPITAIAWDSERELLWIASTTRGINGVTTDGEEVAELDRHDLRIYGLAYWSDDPDGFPLYVFNKERDTNRQTIHKINPDNNEVQFVTYLEPEAGGGPVGAFITNEYDIYSWVFMDIVSASRNAGGDRIDIWQVDGRKDWMQIEPFEGGIIEAGEEQPFVLTLDATGLPPAVFEGEIVFLHDGVGGETRLPIELHVVEGRVPTERTLELGLGWNMVSVNLQPDERDVTVLTEPLVEEDLLEMMKDGFGHFYNPEFGFNNIPGWFVEQGYMLKVRDDCELTLEGESVLADDPIDLAEGWQIVSYYPRRPVEAILALSGIVDQLLIAKDGDGQFYIPEFGFSNMGDLREGRGYQLKMDEAARLVYTLQEQGVAGIPHPTETQIPQLLPVVSPTGSNLSMLVIDSGDLEGEVGVYASGMFVGGGVLKDGSCGIAVWGDDPTTQDVDGALPGELLELRLHTTSGENVLKAATLAGDGRYTTDGLWVVRLESISALVEFGIVDVYPNPFNAMTRLTYDVPEAAQVSIRVYNMAGRLVATLFEGEQITGRHVVVWSSKDAAAGIYIFRMESTSFSAVRKVALVK